MTTHEGLFVSWEDRPVPHNLWVLTYDTLRKFYRLGRPISVCPTQADHLVVPLVEPSQDPDNDEKGEEDDADYDAGFLLGGEGGCWSRCGRRGGGCSCSDG
jgi:hypothetical protein